MYEIIIRMKILKAKELEEGVSFMGEMSKAVEVVQLMKKVMRKIRHA